MPLLTSNWWRDSVIMKYHAHVYWKNSQQRELAVVLRNGLSRLGCRLGRIMDSNIGPHPLPMYQANYTDQNKLEVEKLLSTQGKGLSILLHEDTDDDIKDHTEGARWLGKKLELDLVWLEEYQNTKGK